MEIWFNDGMVFARTTEQDFQREAFPQTRSSHLRHRGGAEENQQRKALSLNASNLEGEIDWKRTDVAGPRPTMSETRKIAAIFLFADIVGYSRLAGADEDRILARLRALRSDLIDPTIAVAVRI